MAALAFGANALQASYAHRQAKYAQRQLDELQAEDRPRIEPTPIVGSFHDFAGNSNSIGAPSNINGSSVLIGVKQTNDGHTPAFNVTCKAFMLPMTGKHSAGALPELEVLCNEKPDLVSPSNYSSVIFPDHFAGSFQRLEAHDNLINPKTFTWQFDVTLTPLFGDPKSYHHSEFQYMSGETDLKHADRILQILVGPIIPEN